MRNRVTQLMLRALAQDAAADASRVAGEVWSVLKSYGQQLRKDGQVLEGDEANLRELTERAGEWLREEWPVLARLRVI